MKPLKKITHAQNVVKSVLFDLEYTTLFIDFNLLF